MHLDTVQDLTGQSTRKDALNLVENDDTTKNGLIAFLFGTGIYAYVESEGTATTYSSADTVIKLAGTPFAAGTDLADLGTAIS